MRLNRRLAPELYLGVVPITGAPSDPYVDGTDQPFEFAVKMQQFSDDFQAKVLNPHYEGAEDMVALAEQMSRFHMMLEPAKVSDEYGTPETVLGTVRECLQGIPRKGSLTGVSDHLDRVSRWVEQEWTRLVPTFVERKQEGWVRECHGDLHLGNIAVFQGQLCVFDALEFSSHLRWIDTMSEIAFLVMDLEKHHRRDLGFLFLNTYLEGIGDYAGLRVFRFYRVYRALVRAKVAGIRLRQFSRADPLWEQVSKEFLRCVDLAFDFLSPSAPRLFLMHGLSGSGKTTVSTHLMKVLGIVRVRSDVERKRLGSLDPVTSSEVAQRYSQNMNKATYARLLALAQGLLAEGVSVIVDATFLRGNHREPFFRMAMEKAIPIHIIDVSASENVVKQRISNRRQKGLDASDATLEVWQRQRRIQEPFSAQERHCVISVDTTGNQSIQRGIRQVCAVIGHNLLSQ